MKNKFVTAVTTAGLLAGILGSAFVPSVKAAAGVIDWTVGAAKCLVPAGLAATEDGTSALPMILGGAGAEALVITAANCKDEFGTLITSGAMSVTASGAVKFATSAPFSFATGNTAGSTNWAGADQTLNVVETSTTAYGAGSVTLSMGGASKTVYYTVVGPVASITLANGDAFTHLAADKSGTADKLTYVEKDAAGNTLTPTVLANVKYSKDGATAVAPEALLTVAAAGTTTDGVYVELGSADGKLTIGDGSCVAADAGKTRTISISIGTAPDVVTSNTISFVCTLGGDKAVLTGATLDDTTLYAGGVAKIQYSFTDGARKLGFGAVIAASVQGANATNFKDVTGVDFPNTFAGNPSGSTKSTLALGLATGGTINKDGQLVAATGITAAAAVGLGNRQVQITVTDADLGTALDQEKKIVLKYSIVDEMVDDSDASIVKSKFTVTADFGAAFAKKKISIVVENVATGSVVTYSRKANSLGKVSYTIGRRGTFEIYAMAGDSLTDTVLVKR